MAAAQDEGGEEPGVRGRRARRLKRIACSIAARDAGDHGPACQVVAAGSWGSRRAGPCPGSASRGTRLRSDPAGARPATARRPARASAWPKPPSPRSARAKDRAGAALRAEPAGQGVSYCPGATGTRQGCGRDPAQEAPKPRRQCQPRQERRGEAVAAGDAAFLRHDTVLSQDTEHLVVVLPFTGASPRKGGSAPRADEDAHSGADRSVPVSAETYTVAPRVPLAYAVAKGFSA